MKKNYFLMSILAFGMMNAQYEPFSMNGAVSGTNNWATHSGSITGEIVTLATPSENGNSLFYTASVAPQGNRTSLSSTLTEDINKTFASAVTTTAYASFFMKITNTSTLAANTVTTPPGYFMHFSPVSGTNIGSTGFVSRMSLRQGSAANTFNIGIINTTGGTATVTDLYGGATPQNYNINTTYFVVLKYDMTGATGVTSFWINPAISSETAPTHTSSFGTSTKLAQVASIILRQANNIGTIELDEIRQGSSWSEVVTSVLGIKDLKYNKNIISNTLVKDGFKVLTKGKSVLYLYNQEGRMVKRVDVQENNFVTVSDLPKGIYVVKITNTAGESTATKIFKD